MRNVKTECRYLPPTCDGSSSKEAPRDWEAHPSWITGMEALNAYGEWVSAVVMPIAFQWIEEHKPDVYATVPEELRDDVGVVIAAAFKLVKNMPAYKSGEEMGASYEASVAKGTWNPAKTNPVWTGITKRIRKETEKALSE